MIFNSSISEININNIEQFIKSNKLIKIYYWNYNNNRINCYVNIEENIIRNNHILPSCGISDIFDIESENIEIENTIYMILSDKYNFYDLTLEEYGLFYFESTENISSSSDDELSIENIEDTKEKNIIKLVDNLNININNILKLDENQY